MKHGRKRFELLVAIVLFQSDIEISHNRHLIRRVSRQFIIRSMFGLISVFNHISPFFLAILINVICLGICFPVCLFIFTYPSSLL